MVLVLPGLYVVSRKVTAEQGWDERLQEARRNSDVEPMSDVEFYRKTTDVFPSAYGPDGIYANEEEIDRTRQKRNRNDDDDEEDELTGMSELEIEKFREEFGLEYDPYYDEPYYEDELPQGLKFSSPLFISNDRIYEDGQTFYAYEDRFYRRGSKPRSFKVFGLSF